MSDGHFRRTARAAIELRVHFRRDEPGSAFQKAGRIADLGMGGAFVESERPPPVGTSIVVTLQAPTAWDPLELPAEVRWVNEPAHPREAHLREGTARDAPVRESTVGLGQGFGLKFRALQPTQAAALYELLASIGFTGNDS